MATIAGEDIALALAYADCQARHNAVVGAYMGARATAIEFNEGDDE